MHQLIFNYLSPDVPQQLKDEFEARINKKYDIVFETYKSNIDIQVSYKGQELRGLMFAYIDLENILQQHSLSKEF